MPNEEVHHIISEAISQHDDQLTIIKKHKLRWYGHVTRSNGLAKTIMQGTINSGKYRGRIYRWEDKVQELAGLQPAQVMWVAKD